jgi:hypothetical protein
MSSVSGVVSVSVSLYGATKGTEFNVFLI